MALLQRMRWSLAIALPALWAVGTMGWSAWQLVRLSDIRVASADIGAELRNVELAAITGLFSYGGSTAWAPLRPRLESVFARERPSFQLRYINPLSGPPGSRMGVRMLLDGRLTFAQTSHPLEDSEYELASQRNLQLEQIPVAIDGIAVVVRPELEIEALTLEQLRDIYSNRIRNWQQVGGPNLPIEPLSRPADTGGTVSFFTEEVLGDRRFGANVQFVPTTTQALRKLQGLPGGIYYASAPVVIPQCGVKALSIGRESDMPIHPAIRPAVDPERCPERRDRLDVEAFRSGQYPLTRYLYVVTAAPRSLNTQWLDASAGEAFAEFVLSERGQDLVEEAGFVRIR